jgi:hypothetical protein
MKAHIAAGRKLRRLASCGEGGTEMTFRKRHRFWRRFALSLVFAAAMAA